MPRDNTVRAQALPGEGRGRLWARRLLLVAALFLAAASNLVPALLPDFGHQNLAAAADRPPTIPSSTADEVTRRLSELEAQLGRVTRENQRLAEEVSALRRAETDRESRIPTRTTVAPTAAWEEVIPSDPPVAGDDNGLPPDLVDPESWLGSGGTSAVGTGGVGPDHHGDWLSATVPAPVRANGWHVGYDQGFLIAPGSEDESPFSLKINNQTMFRYAGFLRDNEFWTDSAGNIHTVNDFSNFQIPRGRLSFSGGALVPDLSYQLIIDYNTVSSTPIGFRAYLLSYEFSEALKVNVGQNKVPGTREWLTSAFQVQGPDRSLATTFFRPSLSQGIWITGTPWDDVHYHAMLSNGFNTSNLPARSLNVYPCWSGSVWWEPWGAFGKDFSDLQWHEQPAIRIGTSQTFSHDRGSQANSGSPENSLLRLSDGTVITDTGALAPGVTLSDYTVFLSAFDLGWKYQGLSLLGELYLQTLGNLRGNGPLPISSTQAMGGYLQGGIFVLPKEFEVYGRGSLVDGDYGTGGEYAGGFNWFVLPGKDNLRVTTDLAYILRSPADQNRTDYNAGYTGWLLRAQVSTSF